MSEYSRRGFIDGIACRVATVAIRPGKPNSALSSFVSGIVREPLAGIETVCPVPLDTRLWISSPATVTTNLVHAARVPAAALERRTSAEPARALGHCWARCSTASSGSGGAAARARVRTEIDERVARVVCTWPGALDASRAAHLGFIADRDVDELVRLYMSEQRG